MIKNVADNQDEILESIISLYCPAGIHLDPCYGTGNFYKSGRIAEPLLRYDILPTKTYVKQGDVTQLGFDNEIVSVLFDPPFLHAHGSGSLIGHRYTSYPNQKALWAFYEEAFCAIQKALKPKGILIWKCQDIVEGGKQVWNHCKIWDLASCNGGLTALDLFVLVASNRIKGHNHNRQVHARKYTSYFWVFRKDR